MTKYINDDDSNISESKDKLIGEVKGLFSKAATKREMEVDEEKHWLLQNCNNPQIVETVKELTVLAFHIIDAIGENQPINSITISKNTQVPKGTVSKIIKKLDSQELIIRKRLPNNKKETVFCLSTLGSELYELHKILHHQFEAGINNFMRKYESHELQFLIRFLKDFLVVSWADDEKINTDKSMK